jgi:hypothetical protein
MKSPNIEPILGDEFAPITSAVGFLELPLDEAAEAVAAIWRSFAREVAIEEVNEPFPQSLLKLTPMRVGNRSRALFVSQGAWTAFFDDSASGTDPVSMLIAVCRDRCRGVAVVAIPDGPFREGSLQFEMFGPARTEFLNYVRTVGIAKKSGRWQFDSFGKPQPFEDSQSYAARATQDRLSTDLVARYCASLGFEPFEEDAYGDALLVTAPPMGASGEYVALSDRQRALGLPPPRLSDH